MTFFWKVPCADVHFFWYQKIFSSRSGENLWKYDIRTVLKSYFSEAHLKPLLCKKIYSHRVYLWWRRQWHPPSSSLAWKIPWMEEPGGLQSMGSLRVRRDWATALSLFTFMHWRRKWQPTPVFLPGEPQGWGSLMGCHLWGRTESGTTEAMQQQQQQIFDYFM